MEKEYKPDINVAKEPEEYIDDDGFEEGYGQIYLRWAICPNCCKRLYSHKEERCPRCMQLIDWSNWHK